MYFAVLILFLVSCQVMDRNETLIKNDSLQAKIVNRVGAESEEMDVDNYIEENTAEYWVVVFDTSNNYQILQEKMYKLSRQLNTDIDTFGRFYNPEKDLIMLPIDDKDEMYAGDYFPRRFPSKTLSIEYLSTYTAKASQKSMALIAGICETRTEADSLLEVLLEFGPETHVLKSKIYVGCMH